MNFVICFLKYSKTFLNFKLNLGITKGKLKIIHIFYQDLLDTLDIIQFIVPTCIKSYKPKTVLKFSKIYWLIFENVHEDSSTQNINNLFLKNYQDLSTFQKFVQNRACIISTLTAWLDVYFNKIIQFIFMTASRVFSRRVNNKMKNNECFPHVYTISNYYARFLFT